MKNIGLCLVLFLAMAGSVFAQVAVSVTLDQDQFLPNQSLPLKVRMVNNSGQTLRFGKDDWISYQVEAENGFIVVKSGDAPQPHGFEVKAAEMATTHADLSPYFDITRPGRYSVIATVKIKDWDMQVSSTPKYFEVVRGMKLWEQEFGVPQSPADHTQPVVRKYILQEATFAKRSQLFLRLTDATETRSFSVFPIGRMISFSEPQARVDQQSNLHVLCQSGAHIYIYNVINPDGEITTRQTYEYTTSSPHLRLDDTGKIIIVGGVRHYADNDVPSNRKSNFTNDIPLPVR